MLVALVLLFFVLGGFCVLAVWTVSWRRWHRRTDRAQAMMDATISEVKEERRNRQLNPISTPKPPDVH